MATKVSERWLACILFSSIGLVSCDYFSPKQKFTVAIPEHDFIYNEAAKYLSSVVNRGGFEINIVHTQTTREAVRMVANGQADLTFTMNHSVYLIDSVGKRVTDLRTILPMFRRYMFVYVPNSSKITTFAASTFDNKIIGMESTGVETAINMQLMLNRARVNGFEITSDSVYNIYHLWGTSYSEKHRELLAKGWKRLSLEDAWIRFIDVNNPFLSPISVPSIPGNKEGEETHTVYSEAVLLGSRNLGDNAVFSLTKFIYQNKAELLNHNNMFATLKEQYDRNSLLFPIHAGANAYLNRDSPSFLERYADTLALLVTMLAFIYAGYQTYRTARAKKSKEQVDTYFTEFLVIKEDMSLDRAARVERYDQLFRKLLLKMTEEKLEATDFHILSRLIQMEVSLVKLEGPV